MKLLFTFLVFSLACSCLSPEQKQQEEAKLLPIIKALSFSDSLIFKLKNKREYIANDFIFPVGKPDAKGYYNAQKFQENTHLGEDWNAVTGGNTDLGDSIFTVANGIVKFAEDIQGSWGNIIRIIHLTPDNELVESLYAHCDQILVKKGDFVQKGQCIGTIGNVDGLYLAHLHFELRHDINLPIGGGYSEDTTGFLHPTRFIQSR